MCHTACVTVTRQLRGVSPTLCGSQGLNSYLLWQQVPFYLLSHLTSSQTRVFHLFILFSDVKVNITSTIVGGYENYSNLTNT